MQYQIAKFLILASEQKHNNSGEMKKYWQNAVDNLPLFAYNVRCSAAMIKNVVNI